ARRRVAAHARQRAPEALASRLLDVLALAPLIHLLAHPRQRVPEDLRPYARCVLAQEVAEGGERRADRGRTDAQHGQACRVGEHGGAEESEEEGVVAGHAATARSAPR